MSQAEPGPKYFIKMGQARRSQLFFKMFQARRSQLFFKMFQASQVPIIFEDVPGQPGPNYINDGCNDVGCC